MNDAANELIIISVVAKSGHHFAAYDLLQTIVATGMRFGPMKIFHYYLPSSTTPLFSLASSTEPGDFDWDRIGELSCTGLCLFMHLNRVHDAEEAFALMVATAEQLADDLDGELRAGHSIPWNEAILQEYEHKISLYQQQYEQ